MKSMSFWVRSVVWAASLSACVGGAVFAEETEANYTKHCASCHSKDGSGDTKIGKRLGTRDYRDPKVIAELKDDKAFTAVREGMKEKGVDKMKPFKDKLSDDEIKALIGYMRKFCQK